MRSASIAFMQELSKGNRNYQATVEITLADGTVINGTRTIYNYETGSEIVMSEPYLTNENIWENGLTIEDAVSNDGEFQLGAAIINECTLVLNNSGERFSKYDFADAVVVPHISLYDEDGVLAGTVDMGVYNVSEADYDEGIVTLTCLDNMVKFDKPYVEHGPTGTISSIIANCCQVCGVTAGSTVSTFPHYDMLFDAPLPSGDNATYRQVISWCAEMAGQFARCDQNGELQIGFYDFGALNSIINDGLDGGSFNDSSIPYGDGDTADGGAFSPWNTGYVFDGGSFTSTPDVHVISSSFSSKLNIKDVAITGFSITTDITDDSFISNIPLWSSSSTYTVGDIVRKHVDSSGSHDVTYDVYQCNANISTPEAWNDAHWSKLSSLTRWWGISKDYVVAIDNELIKYDYDADTVAYNLSPDFFTEIMGVPYTPKYVFCPGEITHLSDPTIESGDVAIFVDRNGVIHPIIVSSTTFALGGTQSTQSSAAPKANRFIPPGARQ